MPYKVYFKKKSAKKWKTTKGTFLRKIDAIRWVKALREKKTHNTSVRFLKQKPRNDYWLKQEKKIMMVTRELKNDYIIFTLEKVN